MPVQVSLIFRELGSGLYILLRKKRIILVPMTIGREIDLNKFPGCSISAFD